jgi:maltose alpha-D-glucosyltransferase/alpha-amylase
LGGDFVTIDIDQLREALPALRWFGDKGRDLGVIDVLDQAEVDEGVPRLVFCLLRVAFADEGRQIYHVPVLVDETSTRDAFEDVESMRVLGELMAHGTTLQGVNGTFHFGGPGLDPLAPPGKVSIRAVGAEQSNTSAILDDDVIVKLFRRVERGSNPDLELNRLLTNEGFEYVPPQVGEIVYEGTIDGDEIAIDLGIAQRFVHGATDGWTEVLRHVHALFDQAHPDDLPEDVRVATEERAGEILDRIEQLGDVTASMHVLLAREDIDPDFAPEPLDQSDIKEAAEGVRRSVTDLIAVGVVELTPLRGAIEDRIDAAAALGDDLGMRTRIHGDYHLGQVLLTGREWLIIDFEGEPARPLDERRQKQTALRDVAGMLRSFNYAALVPLFERTGSDPEERARLRPWAESWEALARERFLSAYLRTAHEGHHLPTDRDAVARALDLFELEKALYEVGYERGHRPHWIDIPLYGVRRLLDEEGSK